MRRPEPRKPRGIFDVINGPWLGRGSWVGYREYNLLILVLDLYRSCIYTL